MLTLNVYDRLLFIRGNQYGTAFLLDLDGRQYIVTARHLVDEGCTSIGYNRNGTWVDLSVTFVGRGRGDADVTVLAASELLVDPGMLLPSDSALIIGEDAFFAGFPMKMHLSFEATQARPIGFAKKGTIAGGTPRTSGVQIIYVDAINNEGLSGGPLLNKDREGNWKVIGVVSGFMTSREQVIGADGEPTGAYVLVNTGLLVATGVLHVHEIIRLKPIGALLTPS